MEGSVGAKLYAADQVTVGRIGTNTRSGRIASQLTTLRTGAGRTGQTHTVVFSDNASALRKKLAPRFYAVVYMIDFSILHRWYCTRRRARLAGSRFLRKNQHRIVACYVVRSCCGLDKKTGPFIVVATLLGNPVKKIKQVQYMASPNRRRLRRQRSGRYWKLKIHVLDPAKSSKRKKR